MAWETIGSIKKFAFRIGTTTTLNIKNFIGGLSWKDKEFLGSGLTQINTLNGETNIKVTNTKVITDSWNIKGYVSTPITAASVSASITISSGTSSSLTLSNTTRVTYTFTFSGTINGTGVGTVEFQVYENGVYSKTCVIAVQGSAVSVTITNATFTAVHELNYKTSSTITFRNLKVSSNMSVSSLRLTAYQRMYGSSTEKSMNIITMVTEDVNNVNT